MKKILVLTLSLIISPMLISASTDAIEQKINSLENELKILKEQVKMNSEDIEENTPILEAVEIEGKNTKIYNHTDSSLDDLRRDECTDG